MPPDPPAYRVELPLAPSTNNLYVTVTARGKRGGMVTRRIRSEQYRAWTDKAALMMLAAGPRPRIGGRVHFVIEGPIRGDIDNIKAIPDLLTTMGVLGDDSQMRHLEVIWRPEGELVTVSIWRMG